MPAAAAQGPDQFIAAPSAAFKHTTAAFFDNNALEELRGVFTANRFEALLARFIHDCRQRLERIKEAHSGEDWRLLRQEAHELGGIVGSFGLNRLSEITRALEAAALKGHGAQVQELILRGEEAMDQGLQKLQAEREAQVGSMF
ncbi:hypothetical protein AVHY2522_03125 [Acidovorax sp. SUPP2522]|uniref:Hpt domain-containing protein n=1 Tax=unclassified Acidovorax TaxID=2684926 RepID=UPI0023490CFA|nr:MULTISPECIES: Hpt domain-containing protein [unclassified Acidovorax]WCM98465.1 Hpt domain-containing protein [Acidovorax sp. GBBC 1281]GKT14031.1 hypothetical protein AVHY2522_03125 [Acidovorax sp. SUPP2522]